MILYFKRMIIIITKYQKCSFYVEDVFMFDIILSHNIIKMDTLIILKVQL